MLCFVGDRGVRMVLVLVEKEAMPAVLEKDGGVGRWDFEGVGV